MKPILTAVLLIAQNQSALAQEIKLTGPQISELLVTIKSIGENNSQTFGKNGATNYTEKNRDSFGRWWVEADQYCSVWPPNSFKACYDVLRDGNQLIWVGESGRRILTNLLPK